MLLTKPWSFKQLSLLDNDAPDSILPAGMLQSIVAPNVTLLPLKIFQLLKLIIKTMKLPGEKQTTPVYNHVVKQLTIIEGMARKLLSHLYMFSYFICVHNTQN